MKGLRSIRPLSAESLRGVVPAKLGRTPKIEWLDPTTLYVEDVYQRGLQSGNSTALVRKIVGNFSWSRLKPPICVRLPDYGNVLVVIDGQHTATAAASHPDLSKIPVLVVDAGDIENRAKSFVGHNRDRLGLTAMAIYRAELAYGDEIAKGIDEACRKSGAFVLPVSVSLNKPQETGATIAIGTMKAMVKNHGAPALARVLSILVKAKRGPIKAQEIAATALTIERAGPDFDARLVEIISRNSAERWASIASSFTADTNIALPIALASIWREELGLDRLTRLLKHTGNAAAEALKKPQTPAAPRSEPAVAAQPKPIAEPVRQPPAPARAAGEAPGRIVERNGIAIDVGARTIKHRRRSLKLDDSETRLLISLVPVMPALLVYAQLGGRVFGVAADARLKLSQLVDRLNPRLVDVRLEVKTITKMGYVLSDLGPAAG